MILSAHFAREATTLLAAVGLSTMMVVGSAYHIGFVYTGFLAKAMIPSETRGNVDLMTLLARHQRYLLYIYKWAALPGLVGSAAFIVCCLARATIYPRAVIALAPCFSAPIKIALKRRETGGLILCGGLTNLWNLLFFLALTASAWRAT